LTDPVWADRASPLWDAGLPVGPKRLVQPALPLKDLPRVDFILISHNHYDHLDCAVAKHFGNRVVWIIPEGLGSWFKDIGITNYVELQWWETAKLGFNEHEQNRIKETETETEKEQVKLLITAFPAQHWSKRSVRDDNVSLWGGWAVRTIEDTEEKSLNVAFVGDTGWCDAFHEIGENLGPFDLSLIPVGAYCPKEIFGPQHVDPQEAIDIHVALRSKRSIGMHWGTFILTGEPLFEPPHLLAQTLQERNISTEEFFCIKIGETRSFPNS